MKKPDFIATELAPDTWCIEGFDVGCNMYLLAGRDYCILIDNGYGEYDPRAFSEQVCGRPVAWTAITHGHFDHAGGCQFFDRVFMSREAEPEAKQPYPSLAGGQYRFDYPIQYIHDGDVIDLGGRTLEVLAIPSHSVGDVAFLDRQSRILFAGDAAGSHVNLMWPQEEPQPTVEQFRDNMAKLALCLPEFDRICVGHGGRPDDAQCVLAMIENATRVLNGYQGERADRPKLMPNGKPMQAPPGKGPRPGDTKIYGAEYRRESEWKHTSLGYDCRYLFETKADHT